MLGSNHSSTPILSSAQASGATPQTGPAKKVAGVGLDDVSSAAQTYSFWAKTKFNGGTGSGPNPSGQVKVQGSFDGGATWIDIATGATQASDDTLRTEKLAEVANMVMPPLIRAVSVLTAGGGGTAPTKAEVDVYVSSNADFTLS